MKAFWTDPRWGVVAWPISTAAGVYHGSWTLAVFSAIWIGVSVQRWIDMPQSASAGQAVQDPR